MTLTLFEPVTSETSTEDMRMDLLIERLRGAGIVVRRYTPFDAPEACERLSEREVALPALFVDNALKCAGRYPTNAELADWVDYDKIPERVCRAGGCHHQA